METVRDEKRKVAECEERKEASAEQQSIFIYSRKNGECGTTSAHLSISVRALSVDCKLRVDAGRCDCFAERETLRLSHWKEGFPNRDGKLVEAE